MKKILLVAAASVALVTLSGQTFAADNKEIGKKIYKQAFGRGCGACHDVSPNPNLVKNINEGTLDEKKFAEVIKEGRNGMPKALDAIKAVGAVKEANLTDDQAIDAIFDYLKSAK
jgi:mono/diheme cytochrome c family protein